MDDKDKKQPTSKGEKSTSGDQIDVVKHSWTGVLDR